MLGARDRQMVAAAELTTTGFNNLPDALGQQRQRMKSRGGLRANRQMPLGKITSKFSSLAAVENRRERINPLASFGQNRLRI